VGSNLHESFSRALDVKIGSNRSFGLVMAVACGVIGGLGFWWESAYWLYWLLAAAVFLIAAVLWPRILYPLNRVWFLLGLALHKVVNPLVMGMLFFLVVTPVGLLMRLFGKRPLRLDFQGGPNSYWVAREKHASEPGAMRKQF
jgi:hypothetical protein